MKRMSQVTHRSDAMLIVYEHHEHLGARSIMATLLAEGFTVEYVPYYPGKPEEVLRAVRRHRPYVIGFSLIFQYSIEAFASLMHYLRVHGISAHFTAGGHFPSLRPEDTFTLLPELDTIVRFEGEQTLPGLLRRVMAGETLEDLRNCAIRSDGHVILTELQPLISDLDALPTTIHDIPRQLPCGVATVSILASRGCLFACSFCSIRQFYGQSGGALRRTRSPKSVVEEMLSLYEQSGVRHFAFQDDDFAARTQPQRRWLDEFLALLRSVGLATEIAMKISCRVDDLDSAVLNAMQQCGLQFVYLGIESGSVAGLEMLNKRTSVEQNMSAVALLKQHDLGMGMGFMLIDPSSTMETLLENFRFLRSVGEDGYFPINFCKMLPYAGTPIEHRLRCEGRLKGTLMHPDYDFLDQRVGGFDFLVRMIFERRNFPSDGLVSTLQQAEFDSRLARHFGLPERRPGYRDTLRALIRKSNLLAVDTLELLWEVVDTCDDETLAAAGDAIEEIARNEWLGEMAIEEEYAALEGLPEEHHSN